MPVLCIVIIPLPSGSFPSVEHIFNVFNIQEKYLDPNYPTGHHLISLLSSKVEFS